MHVLVLNCGSSSVKFAVIDTEGETALLTGLAERLGGEQATLSWRLGKGEKQSRPLADGAPTRAFHAHDHEAAMRAIVGVLREARLVEDLGGVGHRVVHGGERFTASTLVTPEVVAGIERCVPHAPLHNPANLLGIRLSNELLGDLPDVAVFDTSFHQTMPARAYFYPVPYELYESHGVRRYGFHGTSHRYVSARAAEVLGKPLAETALVTAHLGNGCSAAAVSGGESVDTTMGMTPLEGLVMGTRSGDVDPALHAFLADNLGWDVHKVTQTLNKQSGLIGLSGVSNDMRAILEAADGGDDRAGLAIEVFCYRLAKAVAALCVPLGRLDALVFTGGIGENAAPIRARVIDQLGVLGLELDAERNAKHGRGSGCQITREGSTVALVVPTDEEMMIARDTADVVARGPSAPREA